MPTKSESELIAELKRVRDEGGDFLNALYVYRSIQRALPDSTQVPEACEAVLAVMESSLNPLCRIDRIREQILYTFRQSVEFLVRVDGLTSSDLRASLVQTLGLIHLLDGVKDNKVSVQRDFALYEDALRRRNKPSEINNRTPSKRLPADEQLERCRKLREIYSSGWWFMNGLLETLPSITKVAAIMAGLLELLTTGLYSDGDGSGPVFLPHDRYKLLRALPIAMYLYHFLAKKIVIKPEPISAKIMETCFRLLQRYPVVPGVGDYAVLLYMPILGIVFSPGGAYAKDMKRYVAMSLDELDNKLLESLDREYSLASRHAQVRHIHDQLCDRLTQIMKETQNWHDAGEALPSQLCQSAVNLSYEILRHLSVWRCSVHELLCWRKSAPTLHESCPISDDIADYTRIPNRVIRIFQDGDVPQVLDTLSSTDSLAKLFKKSKEVIMPSVETWLNHVVHLFLEQTSKKRGMSEVDNRRIFHVIENLKLHILEGHQSLFEISSSRSKTQADLKYDAQDPNCLVKLRKAAEELNYLCNLHPSKSKLTSYFCGHPGAAAPGVPKATKDFLRQLYIMQEVLKADEHLEKINDFFDLSMREREIEVTGTVQLNRASAVALQLAHGALNASSGGSLEPVFVALELFNGACDKLLTTYKSQLIFLELRNTAMEGLEGLLDEICKHAAIQGKIHACISCLHVHPSSWIDELSGIRARASYQFDCIFRKKTFCLVGYDIDIQSALVDRLNAILKTDYRKLFSALEASKNPALIAASQTKIQILKRAREWLATELPLASWESIIEETQRSPALRLQSIVRTCIVQKLFQEYGFDLRSRRFKPTRSSNADPFTFKLSARPSTPKIGFSGPSNPEGSNKAYGYHDVTVLLQMMQPSEIYQLISDTQDDIREQLREFLDVNLPVLFSVVPLELIDLRISELSVRQDMTAIECLSFVMEKFGSDITETSTWIYPLRNLERIGNAFIFLHWMQISLIHDHIIDSIRQCHTLNDVSNLAAESVMQTDDGDADVESCGGRFRCAQTTVATQATFVSETYPMSHILQECIRTIKAGIDESERVQKRRLSITNAMSAVLFLMAYVQTHENMINVSLGDGVIWAANLITRLSNDGTNFDRVDWIHEILRLTQLDEVLTSHQIPNDIRSFLASAQRTITTWKYISQLRLFKGFKPSTDIRNNGTKPLRMFKDPPLRGFFGGMSHAPISSLRRRTLNQRLSGQMGPLKATMLKKSSLWMSHSSKSNMAQNGLAPFSLAINGIKSFGFQDAANVETPCLSVRRAPDEGPSQHLQHRHSN